MTDVKVEKKGNVAVITIEHMQAMNALSTDMYAQLEEAFDTVAAMEDAYCVVLTGSSRVNKKGKTVQSFVAGADISQMSTMTVEEGKFFGNDSNRVCWKIENFKRPVIAAINGFCLGGGVELAMSCDIRICSENATFGQPEVGLGITPGCGGTQRLARLVGAGKAKEMLYTARGNYSAQDALDMGLVNYLGDVCACNEGVDGPALLVDGGRTSQNDSVNVVQILSQLVECLFQLMGEAIIVERDELCK